MNNLLSRVKILRKQLGFSQEEFATRLGITKQAISNIETGKSSPSIVILYKMLKEMDININYVIAGIGEMFLADKNNEILKETLMKEFEQMLKSRGIE